MITTRDVPMDFTYQEYGTLIELLRASGFTLEKFHEAPVDERKAYLRHDIDMSIDDAFRLANFEEQLGVVSTYYVLLDTGFYNVMAAGSSARLRSMAYMGHDIGLHYVQRSHLDEDPDYDSALLADICRQCTLLSEMLDLEIATFSFHRPTPQLLQKKLIVPGLSNAYASPYFEQGAYISDSNHHWRCGDPFAFISEFSGSSLQVLTHPFWWNPDPVDPRRKLQDFVDRLADSHRATLIHDVGLAASVFEKASP